MEKYPIIRMNFIFWNSRVMPEDAKIKINLICQNKSGHWYLNIVFAIELIRI